MGLRTLFIVLAVVQCITSYNIKIKTQVQNVKNSGDNNNIQLATITNSTILQSISSQVYKLHLNELWSTTAILVTLTKQALVIFKLNMRINNLESIIFQRYFRVSHFPVILSDVYSVLSWLKP